MDLTNRMQYVSVSGVNSELAPVPNGVPQGSVLGPVLFSLFTNDPSDSVHSGETYLYADDTTIYCVAASVDATITKLTAVLAEITTWCDENRRIPHPEKCKAMLLHRRPFTGPLQGLMIGNSSIDWTSSERLLGLQVDHKLTWSKHAAAVTKA